MKTLRNIFAAVLPVLILAACGPAATQPSAPAVTQEPSPSVSVAQPTEIPQPAQQAGINITQAQYDEALAKWRASGVGEYEMVAEYQAFSLYAGTLTLRVKGGEVVEVINFERGGRAAGTPIPDLTQLKFLTVEALFEKIGEALAMRPWEVSSESDVPLDYKVEFDPTLGFPTLLQITALPNPISGAQVADVDTTTRVLSVKKLGSSDTPGMPRSGAEPQP
ncbi:MAG TPA: DUF6174 domain-containing protein [Chloroflexia bacterium]|nr:DUF6174 domain-containing protein [Chloroflexia bacterium]